MKGSLEKVNKSFQKGKDDMLKVLDDINFNISECEFVSLIGPSGCGSSTVLNLIAGLDTPTSGGVLLYGRTITGPGTVRVVVLQEGGLFPWMTVLENVSSGLLRTK